MIWYICFFLSVVIAGLILKILFDRDLGGMRILYVMLGCVAIAYILYIPPFFEQYDFTAAVFGCFINVMQMISLDADYLFFYDLIASEWGGGLFCNLYFTFLAALHFLLPVVSAMTAVTLVLRCLARIQIGMLKRRRRPLYVFSQFHYKSMLLAKDIYRHEKKCDILFLDSREKSELADLQRDLHCIVLNEKIENIKADSRHRRVHYYCISDDQEENLTAALAILGHLKDEEREIQQNNYIFLFSSDQTAELLLDSIPKGLVNINLIDESRSIAYHLLEKYPLPRYVVNKRIHVLICGFSRVGGAFLKAAVWCGQLAGYSLAFSVIGKDIETSADNFRASYPGLFSGRYQIEFLNWKSELEFQDILCARCADANYIVVACDSERETVEKSIYLRRFFYRSDARFKNVPPIFSYVENGEKAEAVAAMATAEARPERRMPYHIVPFGMAAELYSFQNITESDLEKLSKGVHLVYEDIFSEDGINVAAALERYNLFEVNKSSNRANALHIRYKLAMLGLDYTDDPEAEEIDLTEYLTREALDRLTVAEHDRWMAFLESEGWTGASIEEVNAYKEAGVSKGRHNCPLLKMHPYICGFDELKDRSDRLGLPDSTVYDRELIARIPDILHDKWNVSGKKYKIVETKFELGGYE